MPVDVDIVTVTAPPRPPRPSDPVDREELEALVEALFEEARQRARRRRRIYWAVAAVVTFVVVMFVTVFDPAARSQTTSPSPAERSSLAAAPSAKIAFVRSAVYHSKTPLDVGLFVMNPDGSEQKRLTQVVPVGGGHPLWSPDGRMIAFIDRHLYVMNADRSGLRRVAWSADSPAWSPDGRKIAFARHGLGYDWESEIYVIDVDGSNERRLTRNTADGLPAWSPDGRKIAFTSHLDGNAEIYVMNADGTDQRNLTRNAADDYFPLPAENVSPHYGAWSPDGRTIAFMAGREGRAGGIYLVNADGRSLTRAIPGDYAWSPDGRKIAFGGGYRGGPLYVVNADGSERRTLIREHTLSVAWSPDGRTIAFTDGDLKIVNADGSGLRTLTRTKNIERWFAWSPAERT
jgi:Tol biopolymer transport system component